MNWCDSSVGEKCKQEKINSLFNIFPVGMMIFEKVCKNNETDFLLKYINETALKTFRKTNIKSEDEIKKTLKKFNKLKNFSTVTKVYSDINDFTEENLYNRIFDHLDESETEICERYVSKEKMIYVKIKIHQEYKLVTIENFNDERIAIQNNVIKNIKTQYLVTLSHELNNPLNSLAHSVNEIILKNDEAKNEKIFLNSMKINIRLIKFFIKNFIFSVKMSLDMNTIITESDKNNLKKNESCINLEYLFRKIKEKYSIFFQSKKVKLECNFNPVQNIFVTYDYDYFKSIIKNIFMYLFYRIEREGGIKIELVFEKELKIMFLKSVKNKYKNYFDQKLIKPQNHLDTSFVKEFNIESSVKTLKILYDIINKFAAMLGIKLKIIEDESPCYLIMYLQYDIDEDLTLIGQDIAEEFTCRESKKKNAKILNRSLHTLKDLDNSFINRGSESPIINVFRTQNDCLSSDQSIVFSNNYGNLKNQSFNSKAENIEGDEKEGNRGFKTSKKNERPKKSNRLSRYVTDYKNLKNTVTMSSDRDSENKEILSGKGKPKTMFMRSNFTFKYELDSDDDINMNIDLYVDKNNKNLKKNIANACLNLSTCNKVENSCDIINNSYTRKGQAVPKINRMNTINNITSTVNVNKSPRTIKVFSNEQAVSNKDSSKIHDIFKKYLPVTKKTSNPVDIKKSSVDPVNSMQISTISQSGIGNSISKKFDADILVVDDDNFNLNVLKSMLSKLKLSCDTCLNGLECLKRLQNKYDEGIEYKLILMDVMMPVMDGIEASTKIEEMVKKGQLNRDIKIIIISAHNNQEIIKRATRLSVVAEFKSKPIKQTDIQGIIKIYYN